MSDDPFDAVLDRYFKIRGSWSLFVAICLIEKIDPKSHKGPITDTYLDRAVDEGPDPKVRYCKLAIGSMKDADLGQAFDFNGVRNLVGKLDYPDEVGAARYSVDPRRFVAWATAKWPAHTEHLKRAEDRYQDGKKFIGLKPAEKDAAAKQEFLRMVARGEFDIDDPTSNKSEAARVLEKRLTREGKPLFKVETLRKKLDKWIDEVRAEKYQESG